ncbi:MAG: hypothetical protein WBD20_00015 [Pirellulaceae bacterium]
MAKLDRLPDFAREDGLAVVTTAVIISGDAGKRPTFPKPMVLAMMPTEKVMPSSQRASTL